MEFKKGQLVQNIVEITKDKKRLNSRPVVKIGINYNTSTFNMIYPIGNLFRVRLVLEDAQIYKVISLQFEKDSALYLSARDLELANWAYRILYE
jgi:hypothetical protein